jgi:transcriptional regulator with XRE-family HTH domain
MDDDPARFWENVQREIRRQNTTQEWVAKKAGLSFNTFHGWIAKGIFPRANEAVRIASILNTSVEFLVSGAVHDNKETIARIAQDLVEVYARLAAVSESLREL